MRAKLYYLLCRTIVPGPTEPAEAPYRSHAHAPRAAIPGTSRDVQGEDLRDELARHLPPDAEIVMVHCSLNDLQPTYIGGAKELLDALIELCGQERTLAMPAFLRGPDRNPAATTGHGRCSTFGGSLPRWAYCRSYSVAARTYVAASTHGQRVRSRSARGTARSDSSPCEYHFRRGYPLCPHGKEAHRARRHRY